MGALISPPKGLFKGGSCERIKAHGPLVFVQLVFDISFERYGPILTELSILEQCGNGFQRCTNWGITTLVESRVSNFELHVLTLDI